MSIPQKRDNPFSLANIQARHRSVAHRLGAVEPPVRQPAVLPSALPKPGHQNDRKGKAGVIGAETPRKAGIGEQEQGVKGLVDTNDPSDVEGDLQVLDTPTSSQHALDDEPDHPMDSESDDEVLVIDYTEAPTTDIEMGPPIPGDTPSSVAEEFPILGESSRLRPVSECSPIPAKGAVSEAKNPYHPGDLLAELAHLLHDKEITETNVRKDFAQSNSSWSISPNSNAAYHLINASTQIQKDLGRSTKVVQELLELERILGYASVQADDALETLKGWNS